MLKIHPPFLQNDGKYLMQVKQFLFLGHASRFVGKVWDVNFTYYDRRAARGDFAATRNIKHCKISPVGPQSILASCCSITGLECGQAEIEPKVRQFPLRKTAGMKI